MTSCAASWPPTTAPSSTDVAKRSIEPVFGQLKHNRAAARFQRRGRSAARSEWRLLATTHNILKLWRHTTAPAAA